MSSTAIAAAKQIAPVIDLKAGLGIGVGAGSFFIWLTQWLPVLGMVMTLVIGVMTVIYLKKGLKLRDQEIELNARKLRRDTDHNPVED